MTTVVAAAVDGKVYMAVDSCTNVYERPVIGGLRKMLRMPAGDDQVLLGVCGSGGLPGSIAARLKLEGVPQPGEDTNVWAHAVACAISEIAAGAGLVDDGKMDGMALLGWGGRLWSIGHSVACAHPDGRAALGSGEGPAIGALDVLLANGVDPETAVRRAAEVACRYDRWSEPPIHFDVLEAR